MSKKLSRSERKEIRKKTLRSPVQALRPQAHKVVQATPASSEEGAPAAVATAPKPTLPTSHGKPRGAERGREKERGRAAAAAATASSTKAEVVEAPPPRSMRGMSAADKRKRTERILLVVMGIVALAALVSFAGQWLAGSKRAAPTEATQDESRTGPGLPTGPPVDTSPPTIVTAPATTPRPGTAPTTTADVAEKPAPSATATAADPAPTAAPKPTAAPTATATAKTTKPKAPAAPKPPAAPKVVTEDPYN